ncbi:MAG: DUF3800 domain-containing protein [Desulfovibrio sp.]|nr:DUF3800 domain-containing protein [Desulfovibrio sp.]
MEKLVYNIYCDESCHLENDHQHVMLLGCVWCPKKLSGDYSRAIQNIQKQHNANGEIKWTKVSVSKRLFYIELVEWFFAQTDLHFRTLVVQNKSLLHHETFNAGSHDIFYYKMHFSLLNKILSPDCTYNIYLDIKDTRSRQKLAKLKKILCNNVYDFTNQMISHMQNIHSHESSIMQIADLLMGAVSYKQRGLSNNPTKLELIQRIEYYTHRSLLYSTPLSDQKFNIFLFTPRGGMQNVR